MSSSCRINSKKESYWRKQVSKWRASGLSQAEFSRQAGVSIKSFGYWKRRLERDSLADRRPSPAIVAVPIPQPTEPEIPHKPIIVHAWHGVRMEIPDNFRPEALEKIFLVLGRLT
ncbi:MAG: hypothetical protein JEY79_13850 [Pseudodesulfovibrio sp.]|nr:hypothetical protein [Pseudodesulfovibrio sp.]